MMGIVGMTFLGKPLSFMFCNFMFFFMKSLKLINVATLALGSQPKHGVAKLRAKREIRESLHMLLGVQRV